MIGNYHSPFDELQRERSFAFCEYLIRHAADNETLTKLY